MLPVRSKDPILTAEFFKDLEELFRAVGIEPKPEEALFYALIVDDTLEQVLNNINHAVVPAGLRYYLLRRIVGEVGSRKAEAGQMSFDAAVKAISEGDAKVEFQAEGSPRDRFLALMTSWRKAGDLSCFRKLRW